MKINEYCKWFFHDPFGYIGRSQSMPSRGVIERVCAVFALIICSAASLGLFLGYATYRCVHLHSDFSFKKISQVISRLIPFSWNKYVQAPAFLLGEVVNGAKLYPEQCVEHINRIERKLGPTKKIIVPRMDFFATFNMGRDLQWMVFFIYLFGVGASARSAGHAKAKLAATQLMGYFHFISTFSKEDLNTCIDTLVRYIFHEANTLNDAIENPWYMMATTLSFIPLKERDESFNTIITSLLPRVPRPFQNQYRELLNNPKSNEIDPAAPRSRLQTRLEG